MNKTENSTEKGIRVELLERGCWVVIRQTWWPLGHNNIRFGYTLYYNTSGISGDLKRPDGLSFNADTAAVLDHRWGYFSHKAAMRDARKKLRQLTGKRTTPELGCNYINETGFAPQWVGAAAW